MDNDRFGNRLLRNIDSDHPSGRRNVTLDLVTTEPQVDDFAWWAFRARVLANDHDLEGLHMSMTERLGHRVN